MEETISIKFKDILEYVEEEVEDAVASVTSFAQEYPIVIPFIIIGGVIVIGLFGLEIVTIEGILAMI